VRLHKDKKVELIGSAPLFSGCSKKELRLIATLADEIDLRAGKELMRQGAPGREFFVLVEGTVDVVRDGKRITTLGPGDFFGELALVSDVPRTASVTAATPIRALVVSSRDFRRLLHDEPSVAAKVMEAMAERMPQADTH
jgi:CRP-like cAMP-binding protein